LLWQAYCFGLKFDFYYSDQYALSTQQKPNILLKFCQSLPTEPRASIHHTMCRV